METTEPNRKMLPRHFYSLDALRGLAALGVVFWHWQHFFYRGVELTNFNPERQPLYNWFKPFYTEGWRAVDLFFCLSGFIFYWLYSQRIWARTTSPNEFVVLRFSRLYPLHLLTLLAVLAGQQVMLQCFGSYFAYSHIDPYHFTLQLLFASNWGFERGYSFNGPIWSVSVEVLLYAVFFLLCRINCRRWWHLAIMMVVGHILTRIGPSNVGKGMFSFFAGGAGFYIFSHVWSLSPSRATLKKFAAITGLFWVLVATNIYVRDDLGYALVKTPRFFYELVLFPLTLITLALWEAQRGTLGRRVAFLGHISYSSYLLHFPLQLLLVGIAMGMAVPTTIFYTPMSLVLFFVLLVSLSLGSYHFFERPAQSILRTWLLPPHPSVTSARFGEKL